MSHTRLPETIEYQGHCVGYFCSDTGDSQKLHDPNHMRVEHGCPAVLPGMMQIADMLVGSSQSSIEGSFDALLPADQTLRVVSNDDAIELSLDDRVNTFSYGFPFFMEDTQGRPLTYGLSNYGSLAFNRFKANMLERVPDGNPDNACLAFVGANASRALLDLLVDPSAYNLGAEETGILDELAANKSKGRVPAYQTITISASDTYNPDVLPGSKPITYEVVTIQKVGKAIDVDLIASIGQPIARIQAQVTPIPERLIVRELQKFA